MQFVPVAPSANVFIIIIIIIIIRSTSPSLSNKVCLKCPYVSPSDRPSTKSFFDFNAIWYVRIGRRVLHDGIVI